LEENARRAFKTYLILLLLLAIAVGISSLFPERGHFNIETLAGSPGLTVALNMVFAFILYGVLGLFGLRLAKEVKLPRLFPPRYIHYRFILEPLFWGGLLGVIYVLLDITLAPVHGMGNIPHPGLAASLVLAVAAAIGKELMYRLFLIPFLIYIMLKIWRKIGGRGLTRKRELKNKLFWPAALLSSVIFAGGYLYPDISILFSGSIFTLSGLLIIKTLIVNFILGLLAAWQFKQYGFLSAVVLHLGFLVSWNVIWGNLILG